MGCSGSSAGKEFACNAGDPSSIPGSGRSAGEGIGYLFQHSWASLVAQWVKNLPVVWETWVWPLGWEDPWEGNGYPFQYSGLENFMDCIVHGVAKIWTWLSDFHFTSSLSSLILSLACPNLPLNPSSKFFISIIVLLQFQNSFLVPF